MLGLLPLKGCEVIARSRLAKMRVSEHQNPPEPQLSRTCLSLLGPKFPAILHEVKKCVYRAAGLSILKRLFFLGARAFISDHRTPDRRQLQALMREIPVLQKADRVSW